MLSDTSELLAYVVNLDTDKVTGDNVSKSVDSLAHLHLDGVQQTNRGSLTLVSNSPNTNTYHIRYFLLKQ